MPVLSKCENEIDFTITVHGIVSRQGKNPAAAANAVLQAAQQLVDRISNPLRPMALAFAKEKAGKQLNTLRDKVQLIGTLRADDDELLLDMVDKLKKLTRCTAEKFDCSSELTLLSEEGTF